MFTKMHYSVTWMLSNITRFKVPLSSHLIRHDTIVISSFAAFVVIVATY